MSQQFRIYLLPSDVDALIHELRRTEELRILQESSPTAEPVELRTPIREYSTRFHKVQASSIRCYLAQAKDAQLRINFYENPDRWIIDASSEAIEFSGCDFNRDILLQGRFYFQTDLLVDNEILKKRPEFTRWAQTIFRSAKKNLSYDSVLKAYVGNDASIFRKKGGRFATFIKANGEPAYEPPLN